MGTFVSILITLHSWSKSLMQGSFYLYGLQKNLADTKLMSWYHSSHKYLAWTEQCPFIASWKPIFIEGWAEWSTQTPSQSLPSFWLWLSQLWVFSASDCLCLSPGRGSVMGLRHELDPLGHGGGDSGREKCMIWGESSLGSPRAPCVLSPPRKGGHWELETARRWAWTQLGCEKDLQMLLGFYRGSLLMSAYFSISPLSAWVIFKQGHW